jgi:nitrogen regulatory protein PII-like uncharacterized protein
MSLQEKISKMGGVKIISFVLLSLMLSMQSCMSQEEKVECLNELLKTKYNQELASILQDSIESWSSKNLKNMARFKESESTWKIDALIGNSSSDKLFGWVLEIDTDDGKEKLDYINYFSGENRDGQWYFYLHNMPSNWADREKNENRKYTFEQLSKIARKEVVNGGLVNDDCKINDSYINGWIDRKGRNLFEWHKKFLQSSSE